MTLASQKGSGKLGLLGAYSFSSSSDPLDVVGVKSSEDFNSEHIDESVDSMACSRSPPDVLEDEAKKPSPPGDANLTARTEAETEALDSMFDSKALPGSALTEVALDPVLEEGL